MKVTMVTRILEVNDRVAEENRKRFRDAGISVINPMGRRAQARPRSSICKSSALVLNKQ